MTKVYIYKDGDFGLDLGETFIPAQEIRCPCGHFIGYQAIAWGAIKIKCTKCKKWLVLDISPGRDKIKPGREGQEDQPKVKKARTKRR